MNGYVKLSDYLKMRRWVTRRRISVFVGAGAGVVWAYVLDHARLFFRAYNLRVSVRDSGRSKIPLFTFEAMMLRKIPYLLAVAGMVGGVLIAIFFGANEEMFKRRIADGLGQNVKIQAIVDPVEKADTLKVEAEKNWRYYQRFHMHATGLGSMLLVLLLFLSRVEAPEKFKFVASYLMTAGGFFYPFVWLFAGMYGPQMGRHEAKEAFAILGYSGGLFLVGALLVLGLAARYEIREA